MSTVWEKSVLRPGIVRQGTVVHDLQQDVEDVGMGLFYLVQQDHGIRGLAHGLGQQAALVEAHIAWRRTDEARDRVRFHVFAHVIAQELHAHGLGQPAGQLRLAYAGGAIEEEGARGPLTLP